MAVHDGIAKKSDGESLVKPWLIILHEGDNNECIINVIDLQACKPRASQGSQNTPW